MLCCRQRVDCSCNEVDGDGDIYSHILLGQQPKRVVLVNDKDSDRNEQLFAHKRLVPADLVTVTKCSSNEGTCNGVALYAFASADGNFANSANNTTTVMACIM